MSIQCERAVEVKCSAEQAFALLDNLPRTPEWLGPCTAIEKLQPGPNQVGDRLKYSYIQSGHAGVMDGEILARVPNEKLVCKYFDKMMEVVVDFTISQRSDAVQLHHVITITPKTMMAKLMTPLIRSSLPKQTEKAMSSIQSLLESSAG